MSSEKRRTLRAVASEDELAAIISEEIRPEASDCLLLFRGQTELYETVRSGRARDDSKVVPEIVRGWDSIVGRMLTAEEQNRAPSALRQAVLQHYGMATHFLDLSSDANVAAWFACNEYSPIKKRAYWAGNACRFIDRVTYLSLREGIGYVLVLAVPSPQQLIRNSKLLVLSDLKYFTRPRSQFAHLLYDRPPIVPDPNEFWRWTIPIERSSSRAMGKKNSSQARRMLAMPLFFHFHMSKYQVPFFSDQPLTESGESAERYEKRLMIWRNSCFASRALNIHEYILDEHAPGSRQGNRARPLPRYLATSRR